MFARAIDRLQSTYLQAHLYGLRHRNVLHDLRSRRPTLLDVKHKGRSATDGSLKMYAMATRLQMEMVKFPQVTLALGNNVEDPFAERLRMDSSRATLSSLLSACCCGLFCTSG